MNTRTRTALQLAATATAAALLPALAGANISGEYNGPTDYVWNITGMVDFDQRRDNSLPNGIVGLPWGGSTHCVPTSTMNMLAYAASHGYPTINPHDYSYLEWLDPTLGSPHYDIATSNIEALGLLMNTNGTSGTNSSGWWSGINNWLPDDLFDVGMFVSSTTWSPKAKNIGQIAHSGALTSFCYGRYVFSSLNSAGGDLVSRDGGHCVTTRRIQVENGTQSELWYRDPSTGGGTLTQNQFESTYLTTQDGLYTSPASATRIRTRLNTSVADGRVRLLDSIYAIWPKQGLVQGPSGSELVAHNLGGFTIETQQNQSHADWSRVLNQANLAVDFEQSPDRTMIALLTAKKDEPTEKSTPKLLEAATNGKVFSFERRLIDLCWSPEGRIWGFDASDIVVIEPTDADHNADGVVDASDFLTWNAGHGGGTAGGEPSVPSDIFYDDQTRCAWVLFPSEKVVRCYRLSSDGGVRFISESVTDTPWRMSENCFLAKDAKTGVVLIVDADAGELAGFAPCPNGEIVGCQVAINLAAPVGGTKDLEPDGCGNFYFVGADNIIRCYSLDPNFNLLRNPDRPFDGFEGSGFQITRSRTNYDPAVHDEWKDIPVEELMPIGVEIADCVADFTTTGATLPAQPGFGAPDGVVDLDDLGFFLNAWLIQGAVADVTTSGATLEGQAGFGIADGVTDLDDLGFYLNAWLAGCP